MNIQFISSLDEKAETCSLMDNKILSYEDINGIIDFKNIDNHNSLYEAYMRCCWLDDPHFTGEE